MKNALLLLSVFPSLLIAQDMTGDWKGCLAPVKDLGRCILNVSIEQTPTTLAISSRTYVCGQKKFTFQPVELDIGEEETTAAGVKVRPLLDGDKQVGTLQSDGRNGKITETPDKTSIARFGFSDLQPQVLVWSECFNASPTQVVCSQGPLARSSN